MKKSWIVPNLGGWLSIVNLVGVFLFMVLEIPYDDEKFFDVLFVVLLLPIALFSAESALHSNAIIFSVLIVINAFLWGYGIAALIHRVQRDYHEARKPEQNGPDDATSSQPTESND